MSCRRSPPCRPAARLRKLCLQLLNYLLDQEIAERDAAQAVLAVGDRIEDGGVSACSLRPSTPCAPACSVMSQSWQQRQNSKGNQDWRGQDKAPASGHRARGRFSSGHSTE